MTTTVPKFSTWVGVPRGPTTAKSSSPSLNSSPSSMVERPTSRNTMVTSPLPGSESAMVSGTRSLSSRFMTMRN